MMEYEMSCNIVTFMIQNRVMMIYSYDNYILS
jgi:hypothetical protein